MIFRYTEFKNLIKISIQANIIRGYSQTDFGVT